jgi:uncharacterized protein
MGTNSGNFLWYELMTPDVNAAIRFYKAVVGWGTQLHEGSGMAYTIWTDAAGKGIGGVAAPMGAAPAGAAQTQWTAYIKVDDVDAMAKKAASLGATVVVPPTDIPQVGRFSIFTDPDGATMAMLAPLGPDGDLPDPVPDQHVSWHELMANDPEKELAFYSALFGWVQTETFESPMGTYRMYGRDGRTLGGMGKRPADYPAPPHWLYYVKVDGLDAALERVRKAGGQVMHGPMEVPGGSRVAQCMDPQGGRFALHAEAGR